MTVDTAADLRRVALEQFSAHGFHATSIQQIADAAGVAKASVLYHYASKEQLLEAVLTPALDALDAVIGRLPDGSADRAGRNEFLTAFVDFLFGHRLAVHIFVNQQTALTGVPVMARAEELINRISERHQANSSDLEEHMRFGIALAGAAYLLVQLDQGRSGPLPPLEESRSVLIAILTELIGGR